MSWEASRPVGPLLTNSEAASPLATSKKKTKRSVSSGISFSGPLDRRTIAYPHGQGVSLGQGWDFIEGKKKFAACIAFQTEYDKYQDATYQLEQAYDKESLDATLNIDFSGSGNAAGLLKAGGSTHLDAKFKTTSADTLIVAHASIVNGAYFVTPIKESQKATLSFDQTPVVKPIKPPNQAELGKADNPTKPEPARLKEGRPSQKSASPPLLANLQLTDEARKLGEKDPEKFREACGDGFVASIVSGADLYVLFRLREIDRSRKLTIELHTKAGAGFGGLFGGDASSDFKSAIEAEDTHKKTEIHLVQSGGLIEELPIDKDTVNIKVRRLSKEAQAGPRPIYMVVVPYSELANWSFSSIGNPTDDRVAAIRYQKRLVTAYFEYLNIRAEQKRESDSGQTPQYLSADMHNARTEDIDAVGDEIYAELERVGKLLEHTSSPDCMVANERHRDADRSACAAGIKETKKDIAFNDYKFLIRLPVPINGMSTEAKDILSDESVPKDTKVPLYKSVLYRHWVERLSEFRCRMFFDCMKKKDRENMVKMIDETF